MHPFTVAGTRFKPAERVTVTLDRTWVRHVTAATTGAFTVVFRGVEIDRCDGFSATAAGSKGSRAALRVHPLACASVNPG